MTTKGYTVGTYVIKTKKRTLNYLCVLFVKNVKTDPFAKTEKIKNQWSIAINVKNAKMLISATNSILMSNTKQP